MIANDRQAVFFILCSLVVCAYISVLLHLHDTAQLGMSVLFFLALVELLRENHSTLSIQMPKGAALIGGAIIGWVSVMAFKYPNVYWSRLLPFIGGSSLIIAGFGYRCLLEFWRELILLFFMGVPSLVTTWFPDPSPLTARLAAILLRFSGWTVTADGRNIFWSTGAVEVFRGCSGLEAMNYLLAIAVVAGLLFPLGSRIQYTIFPISLAIGFGVNGIRVALLVFLARHETSYAFDYWHEGQGALVFGAAAVMLFGFYYWVLLRLETSA